MSYIINPPDLSRLNGVREDYDTRPLDGSTNIIELFPQGLQKQRGVTSLDTNAFPADVEIVGLGVAVTPGLVLHSDDDKVYVPEVAALLKRASVEFTTNGGDKSVGRYPLDPLFFRMADCDCAVAKVDANDAAFGGENIAALTLSGGIVRPVPQPVLIKQGVAWSIRIHLDKTLAAAFSDADLSGVPGGGIEVRAVIKYGFVK